MSFLLNFLHYVVSFDFFPLCLFILIFLFSNVLRGGHVGQEKAAAKWLISSFFLIFWKEFWYVGSEKLVLFCQISYFDILKGWYMEILVYFGARGDKLNFDILGFSWKCETRDILLIGVFIICMGNKTCCCYYLNQKSDNSPFH